MVRGESGGPAVDQSCRLEVEARAFVVELVDTALVPVGDPGELCDVRIEAAIGVRESGAQHGLRCGTVTSVRVRNGVEVAPEEHGRCCGVGESTLVEFEHRGERLHAIPIRYDPHILGFADRDPDGDVVERGVVGNEKFADRVAAEYRYVGALIEVIQINGRGEVIAQFRRDEIARRVGLLHH